MNVKKRLKDTWAMYVPAILFLSLLITAIYLTR